MRVFKSRRYDSPVFSAASQLAMSKIYVTRARAVRPACRVVPFARQLGGIAHACARCASAQRDFNMRQAADAHVCSRRGHWVWELSGAAPPVWTVESSDCDGGVGRSIDSV